MNPIIDITLKNGSTISFSQFFKLEVEKTALDGDFQFGDTCSSSLNFTIWDSTETYTYEYEGLKVILYSNSTRLHKIGTFIIDDVVRNNNMLEFTCLDYLATKFEDEFENPWVGQAGEVELLTIATRLCNQIGIPLSHLDFTNMHLRFGELDNLSGFSCRQIASMIATLSGTFAHINHNGELEFKFFSETPSKTIAYNDLQEFTRNEEEVKISSVEIESDGVVYKYGTDDGYTMILGTNPLFDNYKIDDPNMEKFKNNLVKGIYEKVDWFQYLPCKFKIHFRDDINLGDTISIEDRKGFHYNAIVSNISYSGFDTMEIESIATNTNRANEINKENALKEEEKYIYCLTSENEEPITLNTNENHVLNTVAVNGVGRTTNVLMFYTLNISSNISQDVKFDLLLNNEVVKTITYPIKVGYNVFNVCEEISTESMDEIGAYKMALNMSENTSSFEFEIDTQQSTLSILVLNAKTRKPRGDLEFHENVKTIFNFWNIRNKTPHTIQENFSKEVISS